jgi:hypothetical protein
MIMPLRKFGIEHGTVEVDQEDPQGLSRTALRHLAATEAAPATEEAGEADEAHPESQ